MSCIDVIEKTKQFRIAGIVDNDRGIDRIVYGYQVLGCDEDLPDLVKSVTNHFFVSLGFVRGEERRSVLFNKLKNLDAVSPIIVSPLAYVSDKAEIGEGTIVMHKAMVNAGAKIGRNCIINSKALIEHGVEVGDHAHVSTAAVVNGSARIGARSLVGSNATVLQEVEIGPRSIVGGGETVRSDLPADYHPRKN